MNHSLSHCYDYLKRLPKWSSNIEKKAREASEARKATRVETEAPEEENLEVLERPRDQKQLKKREFARREIKAAEERVEKRFAEWKEIPSRTQALLERGTIITLLSLDSFAPEMQSDPEKANAIRSLQAEYYESLKKNAASSSENEQ
ncbi:hypothetical protein EDC96DRAFT_574492 [Choanephora cucurbitarum]|nr:hypothetical protein EDC96DRAFT_574492 [Choanephora cucurbitarum]